MIIILSISAFIMVICILIHSSQHFRLRSCKEEAILLIKQSTFDKDSIIDRKPPSKTDLMFSRCIQACNINCCIGIKNNEEFDLFPVAFLLYMIFVLIITILILLKYISVEENPWHTILFYSPNLAKCFTINLNHLNKTLTSMTKLTLSFYIDWVVYVSVCIIITWESFFSFYRYYTTVTSSKYLHSPTVIKVFKSFSFYILIFALLFSIQTQLYYCIFPLVFLFNFMINIYWIYKLSYVLIESFKKLTNLSNNNPSFTEVQRELIGHVNLAKYISLLCIFTSSIYTLAFLIIYHMDCVYYFPIIWAVSMSCFVFNFIRNRQYIIKYCTCHKEQPPATVLSLNPTDSKRPLHAEEQQVDNEFEPQEHITDDGMDGISEGIEIEIEPIEAGATYTNKARKPTKSFIVSVENIDENRTENILEEKLIEVTDITSHSDDIVLAHNINKLSIKRKSDQEVSFSTGDLKSLLDKKSKKSFNVSKMFKDMLPFLKGNELYNTDITENIQKIQFEEINHQPLSIETTQSDNNDIYIPPNGKQSPTDNNGIVILELTSKDSKSDSTPVPEPHEILDKINKNNNSQLKLTVNHGISSDNISQSHLSLNIFDGSTMDSVYTYDDSIDFDNDAITDMNTNMNGNNNKKVMKKPMSTLTLPSVPHNSVRNNMIGMRSSSNPILQNVNVPVKKEVIDPKIAMALQHINSVPILPNHSLTPDRDSMKHFKTQSVGKTNHKRRRNSRHKRVMKNKISLPKQQQLLMMHRNSSAVSVLNLFMKQGLCGKHSVDTVKLSSRNVYK